MQKTDDKHINYSISIANNSKPDDVIAAEYRESRTTPIISRSNDYHFSVVRFSVPMNSFPISYFKIQEGIFQNDANLGVWKIRIQNSNTGVIYEEPVKYIPTNFSINTPFSPAENNGVQAVSKYYFIYSYQNICEMINTTIETLYSHAGISNNIPFVIFENGIFSFKIYNDFIPSSAGYNQWGRIFLNNTLVSQCMGAFSYKWANEQWFELKTSGNIIYEVVQNTQLGSATAGSYDWIKISQNFEYSPQYLSFVRKIYITSSTLKGRKLLINTNSTSLKSPSLPIVFTFEPDTTSPGVGRDKLFYFNSNWRENNIVDLLGNDSLYSLDFQVFVQDNYGEVWPLLISYGDSVEIQFLFSKKDQY